MAKRMLDLTLATLLALALSPLLLLIAVAVKMGSRGPAFFMQDRTGLGGETFSIYKIRTMTAVENGPNVRQARDKDPRITQAGRVLRRWSLDELPQLFNVIKGDMSLVGPRPHPLALDTLYASQIENYQERFSVKPGITGWAQVNGFRGATARLADMATRVEYDLWYTKNASMWLDLKILARTIFAVAHGRNAF
jgi:exopolysaccharide biosynthesis polyprenyl glycosylphosphotransferase